MFHKCVLLKLVTFLDLTTVCLDLKFGPENILRKCLLSHRNFHQLSLYPELMMEECVCLIWGGGAGSVTSSLAGPPR